MENEEIMDICKIYFCLACSICQTANHVCIDDANDDDWGAQLWYSKLIANNYKTISTKGYNFTKNIVSLSYLIQTYFDLINRTML